MISRHPHPLYPVGTRVRHNMSRDLGTVVDHVDNALVVAFDVDVPADHGDERDRVVRPDGARAYRSSQWNWHRADPITHETDPPFTLRKRQICKCQFCGLTRRCERGSDFYSAGSPGDPLACETCMMLGKVKS